MKKFHYRLKKTSFCLYSGDDEGWKKWLMETKCIVQWIVGFKKKELYFLT